MPAPVGGKRLDRRRWGRAGANSRRAKFYALTGPGRAQLAKEKRNWRKVLTEMNSVLADRTWLFMSWITNIVSLFRRWLHGKQTERELDAEVGSYFDIVTDRLVRRGLSREEAMRSARLALEGPEQVKEKVRQARMGFSRYETILRIDPVCLEDAANEPRVHGRGSLDLRSRHWSELRNFRFDQCRDAAHLPVQRPEQLVLLTDPSQSGVAMETTENGIQPATCLIASSKDFQAHNTVFSGMLAAQNDVSDVELYTEGSRESQTWRARRTSFCRATSFRCSVLTRLLGARFSRKNKVPGANPVAVISYAYWRQIFAGDPRRGGNDRAGGYHQLFRILGVAPPGFSGILVGSDADIWFPMTMRPEDTSGTQLSGANRHFVASGSRRARCRG